MQTSGILQPDLGLKTHCSTRFKLTYIRITVHLSVHSEIQMEI